MIPFMFNKHFREFLEFLEKRNVKYLLVGGYAVGIHGFPRYTGDMDVFIAIETGNAEKMVNVFADFGFGDLGLKKETFLQSEKIIEVGREPMKIQVLTGIDGVTFDQCYASRAYFQEGALRIPVIGYEELIQNKLATPRGKDKIDVEELRKVKDDAKKPKASRPKPHRAKLPSSRRK